MKNPLKTANKVRDLLTIQVHIDSYLIETDSLS